ncbi:MAG: type IX secretion system sortase PorU [Bacteroidales bacterium]|nr:type IX secretion system sortase PorU [Bacteroidales bacterium]
MKWKIKILYISLAVLPFFAISQEKSYLTLIEWTGIENNYYTIEDSYERISFSGAVYKPETNVLPSYFEKFLLNSANDEIKVSLKNKIFEEVNADELRLLQQENFSNNEIQISISLLMERKIPYAGLSFVPIRKNSLTGKFEKLVSFKLNIKIVENLSPVLKSSSRTYPDNSVLATGDWYKLGVESTGMYKISYEVLSSMGINPSSINPKNIKIYGNGGGMLPEKNSVFRYNDLQENSIIVVGEDDSSFDQSDYILFYAESSDKWEYNGIQEFKRFEHEVNLYSDLNYYFLTVANEAGKRIAIQQQSSLPITNQANEFVDFKAHEIEEYNLIKSGKDWFGEKFENITTYEFPFDFPNIINDDSVNLRYRVAARSENRSYFKIYANGNLVVEESVNAISKVPFSIYANEGSSSEYFPTSGSSNIIKISYTKTEASSVGWLDYIELNAIRNLIFTGGQMSFRDPYSIGINKVTEFELRNATQSVKVLNITDPLEPKIINTSSSGNNLVFKLATDSLLQFIAYDGSSYFSITNFEKLENQNLHSVGDIDMLIIHPPEFLTEAERLAQLHRDIDNYDVYLVTPQKIYNEFSSGRQDVTAIKDFIKMFYDRAEQGNEIQYVIFFGDASYDYKDRIIDNTNLVPTWETSQSLRPISSIASDDYFAFLDDNEGSGSSDLLDVSLGRFPIDNLDDIKKVVDKTELYITNNQENMGDWRNVVCFVADDEESDRHFNSCEKVSGFLESYNKNINIDKIYLDAYPQVSTPGGERYPEVTTAINNRMEKGNLIMNYMGHGGEVGWAHERVLNISDIINWKNLDKLSVFITATCEFSRYDDPERISAGELVFINPNGGAVSMFTTARPTNISGNEIINKAIYKYTFDTQGNTYKNFGDIMRHAKNEENSVSNTDKMYILFGDPAIGFALPKYSIKTTNVYNVSITDNSDTLKALSKISVEGSIFDNSGKKLENYSGILFPTIFDKPTEIMTLGQDAQSSKQIFYLQNSILYKGKAEIENGDFSFTFVVPKDIAYNYGFGKISYYANNDIDNDASGYFDSIVVGGNSNNIIPDLNGPNIELFMNDENFVFGGITDQDPYLLAFVTDSTGINTVGSGIGHDIVAILDNNSENQIVLNEYYESDINSYQKGSIAYPFRNLSNGRHTLNLKVWDVNNNSSKAYTEFVVAESETMAIENLMNYPNPFKDKTSFVFEHNQANSDLRVEIQIFSLAGKLVKTIRANLSTSGFRSNPIEWYGTSDNGAPIARGLYVYKIKVSDFTGKSSEKVEKLVILK